MRKLALMVGLACLVSQPLMAQEGVWWWSARLTSLSIEEVPGSFPGLVGRIGLDSSAVGLSADISTMIGSSLAVEVMIAGSEYELDLCTEDACLDGGTLWIMPATLTLQYRPSLLGDYHPYAGAGIAYAAFTNPGPFDDLRGYGLSELEFMAKLGLALQLGLDYDLGERWFVNLDFKYLDLPAEVEVSYEGMAREDTIDVDLDPWVVGLGVGRRF